MQRGVNAACRGSGNGFEPLESRTLFSAPYEFAGAGIRYDDGPSAFWSLGVIAEDDSITGTTRLATLAGAGPEQPIDWVRYNRGTGVTRSEFTFDTRDGFTPYDSQSGTRFIRDERRDIGMFTGRDADGAVRDLGVFMQINQTAFTENEFRTALGDGMQMQVLRLTEDGVVEAVTLSIALRLDVPFGNPIEFTFSYEFESGTVTAVRHSTGYSNGVLTLDGGETIVIDSHRNTVLLADLDNTDGVVGIATGRVRIGGETPNGLFRGQVLVNGPESAAFFGIAPEELAPDGTAVAHIVIELRFVVQDAPFTDFNDFRMYRADEYDAGMRNVVTEGGWRFIEELPDPAALTSFRIQLQSNTFDSVYLHAANGRSLFFEEFRPVGTVLTHPLFGVAAGSNLNTSATADYLADVTSEGRPIAYVDVRALDDRANPALLSIDLIEDVGGETVVGDLITWHVAQFGQYWAGLSASGEVQIWVFSSFGWTYANLTREVPGARPIVGELVSTAVEVPELLDNNSPHQYLGGFDESGHFVMYRQFSGGFFFDQAWQFEDTSHSGYFDGTGTTDQLPEFTSDLVGWTSPWGSQHFAGLTADGDIWAVWFSWTPQRWYISNISASVGDDAVPLTGNLAVVSTDWGTFHIQGADAEGDLHSVWWAPGFDSWETVNLTEQFGGSALTPGTLTSNFSSGLSNINVVGEGADGRPELYWWSIGGGWQVNAISSGVMPEQVPERPWRMTSATWLSTPPPGFELDYIQSLLGHDDEGHLVRLVWRSDQPDAWVFEDVTAMSQSFFI